MTVKELKVLIQEMEQFRNIDDFEVKVWGYDNYGMEVKNNIKRIGIEIDKNKIWLVGDTNDDK